MSAIALSLYPSARACANESSRFGPIVPEALAAASVWHAAHLCWKSFLPVSLSPLVTSPPAPQPERRTAAPRSSSAKRKLRGRLIRGRTQLRHGFVARGIDREDAVEAGDLEDLGDVPIAADERQLAVIRAETLDAPDQHAERCRVDEGRVAEVNDDLPSALTDHLEQLLLELRRGVQVNLADERDDVRVGP